MNRYFKSTGLLFILSDWGQVDYKPVLKVYSIVTSQWPDKHHQQQLTSATKVPEWLLALIIQIRSNHVSRLTPQQPLQPATLASQHQEKWPTRSLQKQWWWILIQDRSAPPLLIQDRSAPLNQCKRRGGGAGQEQEFNIEVGRRSTLSTSDWYELKLCYNL